MAFFFITSIVTMFWLNTLFSYFWIFCVMEMENIIYLECRKRWCNFGQILGPTAPYRLPDCSRTSEKYRLSEFQLQK